MMFSRREVLGQMCRNSKWIQRMSSGLGQIIGEDSTPNKPQHTEEDAYDKYEQSAVYCKGRMLHDIQMSRLYPDSKTFVDKKLEYPAKVVLQKYEELKASYKYSLPPKNVMLKFIHDNFSEGQEFEEWSPPDWKEEPQILKRIVDPKYKDFARYINDMWKNLARKVKDDVRENPHLYSILYLPNGFIIPGGRFRELYYWDTYWIVSGLLLCEMYQTAKGITENMIYLVDKLGFVPNGTRLYYIKRSQPPVLLSIVDKYLRYTGDLEFLEKNIHILEKEVNFWIEQRSVDLNLRGKKVTMFRYFAANSGPRPESYWEDLHTVSHKVMEVSKKADILIGIKSAAESGWDFSSRWYINDNAVVQDNRGNLSDTATHHIIPVDLNSLMQKNFKLMSSWYTLLGQPIKAALYEEKSDTLLNAIETVFWRMNEGVWCDYDIKNMKNREFFYGSNFFPLWTHSYNFNKRELSVTILRYLERMKIDIYEGSLTTSIENSRQQWDFPNVWPPLVGVLVEGLNNTGTPETSHYARTIGKRFLTSTYLAYVDFGYIFEKYFALERGVMGDLGEYEVVKGFGWTNGVILEILDAWPDFKAPQSREY